MLSRIFWVVLAGAALVGGMWIQDGGILHWASDREIAASTEHAIEQRVERAVERGVDRMKIVDAAGHEVEVTEDAKRALADAVGRLVEAEVALAMLGVRDAEARELAAANARRDQARAEVDRLKEQVALQQHAVGDRAAVREQIQREVREDIRASIREAVRN